MFLLDGVKQADRRHRLARLALAATAAGALTMALLGLVACGTDGGPVGDGGDVPTTQTPSTSEGGDLTHPTGSDEIVLQISTGGGFVPIEYNLTAVPEFTLYGDGRVIVTGPVIAIYPGPALPNLQTTVISEEAIQSVLAAAKEAGLFANDTDFGAPNVTDLGTTSFIINAEDTSYRSDIYALGFEVDPAVEGLTQEQTQARTAVQGLRDKLLYIDSMLPEPPTWAEYDFQALAVYSLPVDPSVGTEPGDVDPNRLDWPLGDLSTLGEAVQPEGFRRVVVSGDDLATLQGLLGEATQITLWNSGDAEYHLYFRPLLPGEE